MVASAHENLSFEDEASDADPMAPSDWSFSITATGEEVADWDTSTHAAEDFEHGWHMAIASLVPASDPYTSPHAIVSQRAPFALVDGMVLQVTRDGANEESVQFESGDFVDITTATVAEVVAVMVAAFVGFQVDAVGERVRIRSNPFGEAIAVVGHGSANSVLGFPPAYAEFAGADLDLETVPWTDDFTVETFTNKWAGIPAILVTANKAPFVVSNGDDLDVMVNGIAQTVTFIGIAVNGAATAEEVADNITAQLVTAGGVAEATAVASLDVIIRSAFVGFGASLEVTGGTAAVDLGFYPSAGFAVGDGFFMVLPGNTAALWDSGVQQYEDFEDAWNNDGFAWVLTDDLVRVTTATAGVTYIVTLTGNDAIEQHTYTAQLGDDAADIADALDSRIDGNSDLVTSLELGGGVLRLTRIDNRTEVDIAVAVSSASGALSYGTATTGTSIEAAVFDVAINDVEDFEDEWDNDDGTWVWVLSQEYVDVLTAVAGREYAITLGVAELSTTFSYEALGGDDANAIAAALAALIGADPRYASVAALNTINIQAVDTRTPTEPQVSDESDLRYWTNVTGPGTMTPFVFSGPVPGSTETFENTAAYQFELNFGGADPVPAGTYSFDILGVHFEYTSGGADNRVAMSNLFITQINNSSVRHLVEANLSSNDIWISSISCPKTLLDVSNVASPSDTLGVSIANPTLYWDDYNTMCTL